METTLHVCGRTEAVQAVVDPAGPPTLEDLRRSAAAALEQKAPEHNLVDADGNVLNTDDDVRAASGAAVHVQMSEAALFDFERRAAHFRQMQWGYLQEQLVATKESNAALRSDLDSLRAEMQRLNQRTDAERTSRLSEQQQLRGMVQAEKSSREAAAQDHRKELEEVRKSLSKDVGNVMADLDTVRNSVKEIADKQPDELLKTLQEKQNNTRKELQDTQNRWQQEHNRLDEKVGQVEQQLAEARRSFSGKAASFEARTQEFQKQLRNLTDGVHDHTNDMVTRVVEDQVREQLNDRVGPVGDERWQSDIVIMQKGLAEHATRMAQCECNSFLPQSLDSRITGLAKLINDLTAEQSSQKADGDKYAKQIAEVGTEQARQKEIMAEIQESLVSASDLPRAERGHPQTPPNKGSQPPPMFQEPEATQPEPAREPSVNQFDEWVRSVPDVIARHFGGLEQRLQLELQKEQDERMIVGGQVRAFREQAIEEQTNCNAVLSSVVAQVDALNNRYDSLNEQVNSLVSMPGARAGGLGSSETDAKVGALRLDLELEVKDRRSALDAFQSQLSELRYEMHTHSHSVSVEGLGDAVPPKKLFATRAPDYSLR